MATNKAATQLRIDDSLYRKVKFISSKEVRTVNSQIEYFVLKGVEQYEKEHGAILFEDEE